MNAMNWKEVFFIGEKSFKVDEMDGLHWYLNDLRRYLEWFYRSNQGGEAVRDWGEIWNKGAIGINGGTGNMDSWYYCNVLDDGFIPAGNE